MDEEGGSRIRLQQSQCTHAWVESSGLQVSELAGNTKYISLSGADEREGNTYIQALYLGDVTAEVRVSLTFILLFMVGEEHVHGLTQLQEAR